MHLEISDFYIFQNVSRTITFKKNCKQPILRYTKDHF